MIVSSPPKAHPRGKPPPLTANQKARNVLRRAVENGTIKDLLWGKESGSAKLAKREQARTPVKNLDEHDPLDISLHDASLSDNVAIWNKILASRILKTTRFIARQMEIDAEQRALRDYDDNENEEEDEDFGDDADIINDPASHTANENFRRRKKKNKKGKHSRKKIQQEKEVEEKKLSDMNTISTTPRSTRSSFSAKDQQESKLMDLGVLKKPRRVSDIIASANSKISTPPLKKRPLDKLTEDDRSDSDSSDSQSSCAHEEEDLDDLNAEEEGDHFNSETKPKSADVKWAGATKLRGKKKYQALSRPGDDSRRESLRYSINVVEGLFQMSNDLRVERESIMSHGKDGNDAFINRETTMRYNDQLDDVAQSRLNTVAQQRKAALLRLKKHLVKYKTYKSSNLARFASFWENLLSINHHLDKTDAYDDYVIREESETATSDSRRSSNADPTLAGGGLAALESMFEENLGLLFATKARVSEIKTGVGSRASTAQGRASSTSSRQRRRRNRTASIGGASRTNGVRFEGDDYFNSGSLRENYDEDDDLEDDEDEYEDEDSDSEMGTAFQSSNQRNLALMIEKMKALGMYSEEKFKYTYGMDSPRSKKKAKLAAALAAKGNVVEDVSLTLFNVHDQGKYVDPNVSPLSRWLNTHPPEAARPSALVIEGSEGHLEGQNTPRQSWQQRHLHPHPYLHAHGNARPPGSPSGSMSLQRPRTSEEHPESWALQAGGVVPLAMGFHNHVPNKQASLEGENEEDDDEKVFQSLALARNPLSVGHDEVSSPGSRLHSAGGGHPRRVLSSRRSSTREPLHDKDGDFSEETSPPGLATFLTDLLHYVDLDPFADFDKETSETRRRKLRHQLNALSNPDVDEYNGQADLGDTEGTVNEVREAVALLHDLCLLGPHFRSNEPEHHDSSHLVKPSRYSTVMSIRSKALTMKNKTLRGKWRYDHEVTSLVTPKIYQKSTRAVVKVVHKGDHLQHKRYPQRARYNIHYQQNVFKELVFDPQIQLLVLRTCQGGTVLESTAVPASSVYLTDSAFAEMVTLRTRAVDLVPSGYLGTLPHEQWQAIEEEIQASVFREELVQLMKHEQQQHQLIESTQTTKKKTATDRSKRLNFTRHHRHRHEGGDTKKQHRRQQHPHRGDELTGHDNISFNDSSFGDEGFDGSDEDYPDDSSNSSGSSSEEDNNEALRHFSKRIPFVQLERLRQHKRLVFPKYTSAHEGPQKTLLPPIAGVVNTEPHDTMVFRRQDAQRARQKAALLAQDGDENGIDDHDLHRFQSLLPRMEDVLAFTQEHYYPALTAEVLQDLSTTTTTAAVVAPMITSTVIEPTSNDGDTPRAKLRIDTSYRQHDIGVNSATIAAGKVDDDGSNAFLLPQEKIRHELHLNDLHQQQSLFQQPSGQTWALSPTSLRALDHSTAIHSSPARSQAQASVAPHMLPHPPAPLGYIASGHVACGDSVSFTLTGFNPSAAMTTDTAGAGTYLHHQHHHQHHHHVQQQFTPTKPTLPKKVSFRTQKTTAIYATAALSSSFSISASPTGTSHRHVLDAKETRIEKSTHQPPHYSSHKTSATSDLKAAIAAHTVIPTSPSLLHPHHHRHFTPLSTTATAGTRNSTSPAFDTTPSSPFHPPHTDLPSTTTDGKGEPQTSVHVHEMDGSKKRSPGAFPDLHIHTITETSDSPGNTDDNKNNQVIVSPGGTTTTLAPFSFAYQIVMLIETRRIMQLYFTKKFLQMDLAVNVHLTFYDAHESLLAAPELHGVILVSYQDLVVAPGGVQRALELLLPQSLDAAQFSVFVYDVTASDRDMEEDGDAEDEEENVSTSSSEEDSDKDEGKGEQIGRNVGADEDMDDSSHDGDQDHKMKRPKTSKATANKGQKKRSLDKASKESSNSGSSPGHHSHSNKQDHMATEDELFQLLEQCGVTDVLHPPYTVQALKDALATHQRKQEARRAFQQPISPLGQAMQTIL